MGYINNKQAGQGLIEVIIAIFIIASGISGAVTLTYSNLRSNESSITQIIGANLAREGVEVVRNLRDENWLLGSDWLNAIIGTDSDAILDYDISTNLWKLDFDKNGIASGRLLRDANGSYNHTDGVYTEYYRLMTIYVILCEHKVSGNLRTITQFQTCIANENNVGIKVKSEVQWQENGGIKSYKIEENLYNWHDAN
jgi:hypothetical protein